MKIKDIKNIKDFRKAIIDDDLQKFFKSDPEALKFYYKMINKKYYKNDNLEDILKNRKLIFIEDYPEIIKDIKQFHEDQKNGKISVMQESFGLDPQSIYYKKLLNEATFKSIYRNIKNVSNISECINYVITYEDQ